MKARLKIDHHWLEEERRSMAKLLRDYKRWELETLEKARQAKDLETLRRLYYELGDRWEWDQATGSWLSKSDPFDAFCIVLHMPGIKPDRERYVIYAIMAYSKGATDSFDHLGDKERVILERNLKTGEFLCWSTTGHGMVDLKATRLPNMRSLKDILDNCYIIAQPGDHALRLEIQMGRPGSDNLHELLWAIVNGLKEYEVRTIEVLNADDVERKLDFQFFRYANAVLSLERKWQSTVFSLGGRVAELVLDRIPDDIEAINNHSLRMIEGLLHKLWFSPPFYQLTHVRAIHQWFNQLESPTALQKEFLPYLAELRSSLENIIEKAQYIKWKSVMDKEHFSSSEIFEGLSLSEAAKTAFAVALDDVLHEHTLSYIGYPERATLINKISRRLFGILVLPVRLAFSFWLDIRHTLSRLRSRLNPAPTESETEKQDQ